MKQANRTMLKVIALSIGVVSVIVAALCFRIPVSSLVDNPVQAHTRTAFAALVAVPYIGSAIWFMSSLRHFKASLRVAYILLGIGIIVFAIAIAQLPVAGLLGQWDSAWLTGGGAVLVFMAGTVFMYAGMRRFARILGAQTRLASFKLIVATTIAIAVAAYGAAQFLLQYENEGTDVYIAAAAWTTSFAVFASLLARHIKKVIGPDYRHATKWLTFALIGVSGCGLHETIGSFFIGPSSAFSEWGFYMWPFIVGGMLWIKASYEFRLLTAAHEVQTVPGQTSQPAVAADKDYINSILSIARLASQPEEIDSIVDDMRLVTASLPSDASLNSNQKARLLTVYHQLETYLIQKDRLRTFTKEELRSQLAPGFTAMLNRQH